MHLSKSKLNEPSKFKHSKNRSVITPLPLTQNKFISNLLEKNAMIKNNKAIKQDLSSCCSKLSTTFENIFSSDQKRIDAMQLVKSFRNTTYSKKDPNINANTYIAGNKDNLNKDLLNQLLFKSTICQESPILSIKKTEDNEENICSNLNEPSPSLKKSIRKKHLSQEDFRDFLENCKSNESYNENGISEYNQGRYQEYKMNTENKDNKIRNSNMFLDYNKHNNRDKDIKTRIMECSPIKIRDDNDLDNKRNSENYQLERRETITIKGIQKINCFTKISIENLKGNTILIEEDNKKANIELEINKESFNVNGIVKDNCFNNVKLDNSGQFSLISQKNMKRKDEIILYKVISKPSIINKDIISKSSQVGTYIALIQKKYRQYVNQKRINKEKGNLTGIKINFYYKGNAYAQSIIDFNTSIKQINQELREILLKGSYDDTNQHYLEIKPFKQQQNMYSIELKETFCINQSIIKPNDKPKSFTCNKIRSIESMTLVAIKSFKDYLFDVIPINNINIHIINNTNNIHQELLPKTNSVVINEQDNLVKEIEDCNNNNNNTNNQSSNQNEKSPVKIKRMQTEKIKSHVLDFNTFFPENDKVKQYIDDKPISKNKKKPTFVTFDEEKTKSKEIEAIENQKANEGKSKASQLRKKMKSSRILTIKLLQEEGN